VAKLAFTMEQHWDQHPVLVLKNRMPVDVHDLDMGVEFREQWLQRFGHIIT
jgi:hypothetical protein